MRALYIGQCNVGSTSLCRYEVLKKITNYEFDLVDISVIVKKTNRFNLSLGWRFYIGPLIWKINRNIKNKITQKKYYIVWIDKGVFISEKTMYLLRATTNHLIHYTPDVAFLANKSSHFIKGLKLYDYVITTKSFEINHYLKYVAKEKVYFLTQGYNKVVHFPHVSFNEKEEAIAFVGLYTGERAEVIFKLVESGFKVYIGGIGWSEFLLKNQSENLCFIGAEILDFEYSRAISRCYYALGLLQKKFPELHTTRTFEIPACGTCLLTERNDEIDYLLEDDECIKYTNPDELVSLLKFYSTNILKLKEVTTNGLNRIREDNRDYESQIAHFFDEAKIDLRV